jgi:pyruvate kinase
VDALNETAVGNFPHEAVATMARTAGADPERGKEFKRNIVFCKDIGRFDG